MTTKAELEAKVARLEERVFVLTSFLRMYSAKYDEILAEVTQILEEADRPARKATETRQARSQARRARARALRDESNLSIAQIAQRIAQDEGRPDPFPARTIERWLSEKNSDRTT